jgi:hypothetical protein
MRCHHISLKTLHCDDLGPQVRTNLTACCGSIELAGLSTRRLFCSVQTHLQDLLIFDLGHISASTKDSEAYIIATTICLLIDTVL